MNNAVAAPGEASMGRFTLRFDDAEVERQYQASRRDSNLRQLRLSLAAGTAINAGFAPLDLLVLSKNLELVLSLRVGVASVMFLSILAASFHHQLRRKTGRLAGAATLGFTVIFAAINAIGEAPDVYLSGYVLVILFLLVFVPIGFLKAALVSWFNTLLFAIAIPVTQTVGTGALVTVYSQFIAANLMGLFALYWMEKFHRLDFVNLKSIAAERGRYRSLLNRILPVSIVERLEGGEAKIADDYADATVLFADLAGFTETSARCAPSAMVTFLNETFAQFDVLVEKHGVEKIKTIGDAYMAAGGLPDVRPDHAQAVAALALDMMDVAATLTGPDGKPVRIRIGIDTGPLIAGVIGESRFVYDLWGDTVNTASRLESLGTPGCIQVSETVHRRLSDEFEFEYLGEISAKGKGTMKTWQLLGPRSSQNA